ncbi:MAG: phosphate signaling complex protein PhoU [Silicimonas sp.]|nr:phosphate signaling complex protein PhoU [Silicimonas sp.]
MDNTEQHIASAFDRDLDAIQGMLMKMGGLVENAILESANSLENRDVELAERVRDGDKDIDALEEQVNEEATRVIALRAPTARDLRTVMTVIKISANLERCGDYAKNLAKRTTVLAEIPPVSGADVSVKRMAREVQLMLNAALDAYIARDADMAERVILQDEDVDKLYNAIFRELLTHMMEDPRNITPCMHLHFIAKNIERMGDHVTSIAEQVIYLVTGKMPDDARPKKDKTPFMDGGS